LKRKYHATWLITLICVLLLIEPSCAEEREGILERLYRNTTTPESARVLVEPVNLSQADGPFSLTIDEILYDGSGIYVQWTARSDSGDTMLFMPGILLPQTQGFGWKHDADDPGLTGFFPLGDLLDGQSISRDYSDISSLLLPDGGTLEPFEVKLHGYFLKPTAPILNQSEDQVTAISGPVWILGWYPGRVKPGGNDQLGLLSYYTALKKPTYEEVVDATIAGLQELGYAQLLSEISLTITVKPDTEHIFHTMIEGPSTFEFDECTVVIEKADFSAAHFLIEASVDQNEEVVWPTVMRDLTYELHPDGNKIELLSAQRDLGLSDDGRLAISLAYTGNPTFETPSTLLFKAYVEQDGVGTDPVRLPEYDIILRLKKTP